MREITGVFTLMGITEKRLWCVGVFKSESEAVMLRKRLQERSDRYYYGSSDNENVLRPRAALHQALEHEDPGAVFCQTGCSYAIYPADYIE